MRSKKPIIRLAMSACLVVAGCSNATTERVPVKHAQLELLAQSASSPGKPLWLGVHFVLEKGWHIYWVNPGDSGQPPVFQWQLPPGFSAGDIQWPRPEKMQKTNLADYGYHDDVLLLVPVQASQDAKNNSRGEIGLDAKWLICREICLPDHAQLHLALPIPSPAKNDSGMEQLFAKAKNQVPRPLPAGWKARAESRKGTFVLIVDTDRSVTANTAGASRATVDFYPLEPDQIKNSAPQVAALGDRRVEITLQKSDQLIQPASALKGVLVMPGDVSYRIEAPVVEMEKPGGKSKSGIK
ncbi:MAG TPA: protein-disulfide reductase DsbD domain-containing protein, partial [Candidatus Angelobacter sp.]|nr:protein-disulfide reductase DsbD domain-containing protein [Candidatus Angelobacter sp.]